METLGQPRRAENRFVRRAKRWRVISLVFGALLLAVAAPELGILAWTPVRGAMKPALPPVFLQSPHRALPRAATTATTFATPWIVPDPPPLVDEVAVARPHGTRGIFIKASAVSWVTVCADGRKVYERLFEAGTAAQIPFSRQATLRSGNAGALEIEVAGRAVGLMGPWGAIRMIKATPAGFEFITPVIMSGCNAG